MEDIITNDWDFCDMSPNTITYNEVIYQLHEEDSKDAIKAFLWYDRVHILDYEKSLKKPIQYERMKVQSNNQTGGTMVVGTEQNKLTGNGATRIMFQPSLDSRKSHLVSNDQSSMICYKTFVTNYHILVQFSNTKVPKRDSNGCVVISDTQSKDDEKQTVILDQKGQVIP